jgi:hypothetical protein
VLSVGHSEALGNENLEWQPDHFGFRVAEDVLGAFVEDGNPLCVVDGHDGVGRDRDDPRVLRLGQAKGLVGLQSLRDVADSAPDGIFVAGPAGPGSEPIPDGGARPFRVGIRKPCAAGEGNGRVTRVEAQRACAL